ncbi:ABC transporter ATP-binding protein [uncultured Sutterella sp.]|uniref:ABC transporter ATP-binding protein n=1 Tax=uncultured Sutterella sp. TaxID=286133 RepID=UPI0025FF02D6|nr:ABC transporter ATP-binding protein [uncultured Sutterella sp.]
MSITLAGVTKSFGGVTVIPPLNLEFATGAFTTLLGPSGCGKTTLLRMIAGLETPDAGEIHFDGKPVWSGAQGVNLPPEDRGIGFVFQDFALWPHLSVFENVAFALRARGDLTDLRARVAEALSLVGLADFAKRRVSELSGGQQQRVGFARAIVPRPKIILFDEPLSALDALLRETMRFEITAITRRLGMTSIFVTHDQMEAMSMSDRIVVMLKGAVEQTGTPEEIYRHPATRFTADFVGKSNFIDATHLFRPESAGLLLGDAPAPDPVCEIFRASVERVEYLGNRWLVEANAAGRRWRLEARRPLPVGTSLRVAVHPADIVQVGA